MLGKSRTWTAHIPVDYDNKAIDEIRTSEGTLRDSFFHEAMVSNELLGINIVKE